MNRDASAAIVCLHYQTLALTYLRQQTGMLSPNLNQVNLFKEGRLRRM